MGTSQGFKQKLGSEEKTKYLCPYCKQRRVRILFSIRDKVLYEKRICMNLECYYYEYKKVTNELEVKSRLKKVQDGV
jgi:hypothetical protein